MSEYMYAGTVEVDLTVRVPLYISGYADWPEGLEEPTDAMVEEARKHALGQLASTLKAHPVVSVKGNGNDFESYDYGTVEAHAIDYDTEQELKQ